MKIRMMQNLILGHCNKKWAKRRFLRKITLLKRKNSHVDTGAFILPLTRLLCILLCGKSVHPFWQQNCWCTLPEWASSPRMPRMPRVPPSCPLQFQENFSSFLSGPLLYTGWQLAEQHLPCCWSSLHLARQQFGCSEVKSIPCTASFLSLARNRFLFVDS